MEIKVEVKTSAGEHSQNCDYFVAEVMNDQIMQGIFGVFDGVNSLIKGADASRISGSLLNEDYQNNYPIANPAEWLFFEFNRINRKLRLMSEDDMFVTTASVLMINNDDWYLIHTGDSRIYIVGDNPGLLTEDQTLFNEKLKKGQVKEGDKLSHFEKNVLMHSLGQDNEIEVILRSGKININTGFILATDGISDYLNLDDMITILEFNSFDLAYKEICKRAEIKGSKDDKTLMYIKVNND